MSRGVHKKFQISDRPISMSIYSSNSDVARTTQKPSHLTCSMVMVNYQTNTIWPMFPRNPLTDEALSALRFLHPLVVGQRNPVLLTEILIS